MAKRSLTDAFIKNSVEISTIFRDFYLPFGEKFNDCPYIIVISLLTKTFAKLTIYPLNRERVLRVAFIGFDVQIKNVEDAILELKNFNIIHTSGLACLDNKPYYECYLDLSFFDEDYKDLKNVLDKIKNKFEDIKIVEISLK